MEPAVASRRVLGLGLLMALAAAPAAAQFSDSYLFLKAVRDRDVLKAKSLIDKPGSAIINARDYDSGETALMIAIKRRDPPWIGFLLQQGADPNQKDREGNSPLMLAAGGAFPEGVRIMLAGKARVDERNGRGETALVKAVHARDAQSVQLLLAAGADPDRPDNLAGLSARDYAARDARSGPVAKLLADAPKRTAKRMVGPSL
jgi:ankyrin repeat protein